MRALHECTAHELWPLLQEECRHWRGELAWDFRVMNNTVAGALERGALTGRVLQDGRYPLAYCYALGENGRLVVGSLFAARQVRGCGLEEDLLQALLGEVQARPEHQRVECQTLFSTALQSAQLFEQAGFRTHRRHYLVHDLAPPLPRATTGFRVRPFQRGDVACAAALVHASHTGSPDAAFNATYSTPALCRTYLEMLVERDACGPFERLASYVAEATRPGAVSGVVIASRLSRTTGHICQVSVAPEARRRGLGSALTLYALAGLRRAGLRSVSLSVTVGNHGAYALYEKLGFRLHREFTAHTWVRPSPTEPA